MRINQLKEAYAGGPEGRFLWYPVGIAIGIIMGFKGLLIPLQWLLIFAIAISILLYYVRQHIMAYFISMIALMLIIGNAAIAYRIAQVKAPILEKTLSNVWISGDVQLIDERDTERRFYLINLSIKQLQADKTPKRIRVNVKTSTDDFNIGDRIRVKCGLLPPPGSVIPGGFDFSRFAYFKQLGAIGYAVSKPFLVQRAEAVHQWQDKINNFRIYIRKRLEAVMPQREGAIAAGLLVGDAAGITKADFEYMRIAGTAHLIAISGMHIALIAGMLFLSLRFVMIRIEALSKRYNVKKYAALLAIVGSYAYLLLAGSPVSAERAFVMSSIVLIAIIIDRSADAMRSLAIASMVLLVLQPENILSPSLQMSLAACVGLISGFRSSVYLFMAKIGQKHLILRGAIYLLSVIFATITAGLMTSVFIAYHFNQFSLYSVAANVIAVPLTDFIIMPLGFLGLILMPTHLEWLVLIPMAWSINLMMFISRWISELDHASIFIPHFPDFALTLIIAGGLSLYLLVTQLRYIGIPLILGGLYVIYHSVPPDIMLSSSAKLFAVRQEQSLMFSSRMRERFVRKSWMQAAGSTNSYTLPEEGECNRYACRVNYMGNVIVIVLDELYLERECIESQLFINMTERDFTCAMAKKNLNQSDLQTKGPHAIYFKERALIVKP